MSYKRLVVLLAIKEPLTSTQQKAWDVALLSLKKLKSYASKINMNLDNEEDTVVAKHHVCHHDDPDNTIKCSDTEQEI